MIGKRRWSGGNHNGGNDKLPVVWMALFFIAVAVFLLFLFKGGA